MLDKFKNKLNFKIMYSKYLIILVVFIFSGVIFYNLEMKGSISVFNLNKGEWITVSVTDSRSKSSIRIINTRTGKISNLLSEKNVMVTGKVNSRGDILIYSDAIGSKPWDIFKLNVKTKEIYQITNDPLGEFNLRLGNVEGTLVFAKSGNRYSPVPKIARIDTKKEGGEVLDLGLDVGVQDFDVRNNKIVAITFSYNEFITKRFKQNDNSSKIKYSIIEMDANGKIIRQISNIIAVELDSVYFSKSGDSIILGGKGIVGDEVGFYKLHLKNGEVNIVLTEEQLKEANNQIIFSKPYTPFLSYDENKIYFTAIPNGTQPKEFFGIITYPNAVYCYNLKEKRLNEIFKVPDTFIHSVSFTYQ